MDPLSLSASVAGLLSLALEVTKTLHAYISDVKSAPQDACELETEVSALCHSLETIVGMLRSEDVEGKAFDDQSILRSVISACQGHIESILKMVSKLRSIGKAGPMAWMAGPFKKDECQRSIQTLHPYVQTLQVLPIASNR
jgi:hypothetical protein